MFAQAEVKPLGAALVNLLRCALSRTRAFGALFGRGCRKSVGRSQLASLECGLEAAGSERDNAVRERAMVERKLEACDAALCTSEARRVAAEREAREARCAAEGLARDVARLEASVARQTRDQQRVPATSSRTASLHVELEAERAACARLDAENVELGVLADMLRQQLEAARSTAAQSSRSSLAAKEATEARCAALAARVAELERPPPAPCMSSRDELRRSRPEAATVVRDVSAFEASAAKVAAAATAAAVQRVGHAWAAELSELRSEWARDRVGLLKERATAAVGEPQLVDANAAPSAATTAPAARHHDSGGTSHSGRIIAPAPASIGEGGRAWVASATVASTRGSLAACLEAVASREHTCARLGAALEGAAGKLACARRQMAACYDREAAAHAATSAALAECTDCFLTHETALQMRGGGVVNEPVRHATAAVRRDGRRMAWLEAQHAILERRCAVADEARRLEAGARREAEAAACEATASLRARLSYVELWKASAADRLDACLIAAETRTSDSERRFADLCNEHIALVREHARIRGSCAKTSARLAYVATPASRVSGPSSGGAAANVQPAHCKVTMRRERLIATSQRRAAARGTASACNSADLVRLRDVAVAEAESACAAVRLLETSSDDVRIIGKLQREVVAHRTAHARAIATCDGLRRELRATAAAATATNTCVEASAAAARDLRVDHAARVAALRAACRKRRSVPTVDEARDLLDRLAGLERALEVATTRLDVAEAEVAACRAAAASRAPAFGKSSGGNVAAAREAALRAARLADARELAALRSRLRAADARLRILDAAVASADHARVEAECRAVVASTSARTRWDDDLAVAASALSRNLATPSQCGDAAVDGSTCRTDSTSRRDVATITPPCPPMQLHTSTCTTCAQAVPLGGAVAVPSDTDRRRLEAVATQTIASLRVVVADKTRAVGALEARLAATRSTARTEAAAATAEIARLTEALYAEHRSSIAHLRDAAAVLDGPTAWGCGSPPDDVGSQHAIDAARAEARAACARAADLDARLAAATAAASRAEARCGRALAEVAAQKADLVALAARPACAPATSEARHPKRRRAVAAEGRQLGALRASVVALKAAFVRSEEDRTAQYAAVPRPVDVDAELVAEVARLRTQLVDIRAEARAARSEVEVARDERDAAARRVETLALEVTRLGAGAARAEACAHDLDMALAAQGPAHSSQSTAPRPDNDEQDADAVRVQRLAIRRAAADCTADGDATTTALVARLERSVRRATLENERLRRAALPSTVTSLERRLRNEQARSAALEARLASGQVHAEFGDVRLQANLESTVERLRDTLAAANGRTASLDAQVAALVATNARLRHELAYIKSRDGSLGAFRACEA